MRRMSTWEAIQEELSKGVKLKSSKAHKPLEPIHTDVCRLIKKSSLGKSNYFLVFIEDTWEYFLKDKSEVFKFKSLVEKERGLMIKAMRSNHGGVHIKHI